MTASTLLRDRNFMALWAGQSVSEIGSAITGLALPLLAVTTLHAGTVQVGILQACSTIPFLLVSIPAGSLVDRSRKRILMIGCDIGRGLLLAVIPLTAALSHVVLPEFYLVAFFVGAFNVIFGLAYHAFYPIFVPREDLPEANAKIAASEAAARVGGPNLAAVLVGLVGIATILFDVASFAASCGSVLFIKTKGDIARPARRRMNLRADTREGFRLVRADSVLASTAVCTVASVFVLGMTRAVFIYFLVHDLHVRTGLVGITYGLGEAGGLAAAVFAGRLMRRLGTARIMWLVVLVSPAGFFAVLASHSSAVPLASLFMVLSSARFVLFDIAQYSYRQTVCPLNKLGQANATIRLGVGTAGTVGALFGGWLGTLVGARATVLIATTMMCAATLPVLLSPLRRVRDISELLPSHADPAIASTAAQAPPAREAISDPVRK